MLVRIVLILCSVVIAVMSFAVFADVVWQRGSLNYIENDHSNMLYYDGYGQCNSSAPYAGEFYLRVAIRYCDANNDTGFLWTPNSGGRTVSVSRRFYDSLNPFAPPTEFYYDFESTN